MEWTLSEAGHLRYGGRYFCMDPVWGKMVCGASERQRSPGKQQGPWENTFKKEKKSKFTCGLTVSCVNTQMSWRWTFYSLQVSDFTWSHDGTQALIAYRDGFVLVGSVSGQRHWSSEINLESQITCGIWTPDDQQVHVIGLNLHKLFLFLQWDHFALLWNLSPNTAVNYVMLFFFLKHSQAKYSMPPSLFIMSPIKV